MAESDGEWLDRRRRLVGRIEILDGMISALDHWHEVSRVVEAASNHDEARQALLGAPFSFNEYQVEFVLDMTISRLTAAGRAALEQEVDRFRVELQEMPPLG